MHISLSRRFLEQMNIPYHNAIDYQYGAESELHPRHWEVDHTKV